MTSVLIYLLVLLEAVVSFLLISIILAQRSKSQGIGMAFGASMGETLFGSNIGNVLTRTTTILGIIFLVNTTVLAVIGSRNKANSVVNSVTDTLPPQAPAQAAAPAPQPTAPAQLPMQNQDLPVANVPEQPPAADTPATPDAGADTPDTADKTSAAPAK